MHNLSNHVQWTYSSGLAASGTSTDITSAWYDMRGFEGVAFLIGTETTGATAFTAYAQLSATSSGGGAVSVYGSTVTHTTGFATAVAGLVIDVFRPNKRYVNFIVDRGTTDESMGGYWVAQYRPGLAAPSQTTGRNISDCNIVVGTSS